MSKSKCKKCGSNKINMRHIKKEQFLGKAGLGVVDSEFISLSEHSSGFDKYAKKEFLSKVCSTCEFKWYENTLDSADKG